MIFDVTGAPVTLRWLLSASPAECARRLGEPSNHSDGARWSFPNGDEVRKGINEGGHAVVAAWLDTVRPFTVETALTAAGLPAEIPFEPNCAPDGEMSWPYWPGVGRVTINVPLHIVMLAKTAAHGGGSGKPASNDHTHDSTLRRVA